jgi:hypothetical protein
MAEPSYLQSLSQDQFEALLRDAGPTAQRAADRLRRLRKTAANGKSSVTSELSVKSAKNGGNEKKLNKDQCVL